VRLIRSQRIVLQLMFGRSDVLIYEQDSKSLLLLVYGFPWKRNCVHHSTVEIRCFRFSENVAGEENQIGVELQFGH
jgi:hypothetical protein